MSLPDAAEAKLARAQHHIDDLNWQIQSYLAQEPFKIVRRFDPEVGRLSLTTKTEIPIPDKLPCIVGDAIHNLRATLDHAYFAVLIRFTPREDNLQFPVWRLGDNSKESVLGRRMVKLAPKEVRTAIEDCEPYPGGRYKIHELDVMDVRDKHRLPVLLSRASGIQAAAINLAMPEFGVRFGGPGSFKFVGEGDSMFSVNLPLSHPSFAKVAYENEVGLRADVSLASGTVPLGTGK